MLPVVNDHIDWSTVATIFLARHVDRLSPRISKEDYDAIEADLARWLKEWLEPKLPTSSL
jgi:hypothetical protein